MSDLLIPRGKLWYPGRREQRRGWKSASGGGGGSVTILPYNPLIMSYSPTLWWQLDEPSGLVAADSSGNGNVGVYSATGVTYGVPGPITGHTGVTLDGAAGAITSAYVQSSSDAMSIICWYNGLPASWAPILCGTDFPFSSGLGFCFAIGTLSAQQLFQGVCDYTSLVAGGTYSGTQGCYVSNDVNWHMVAMTASKNYPQGEIAYLDGVPVGANNSRLSGGHILTPSTNTFQVGKPYGAGSYWPKSAAQAILWDGVCLTATQIDAIWAAA